MELAGLSVSQAGMSLITLFPVVVLIYIIQYIDSIHLKKVAEFS